MIYRTNLVLILLVISMVITVAYFSDSAKGTLQVLDLSEGATSIIQKLQNANLDEKTDADKDKDKEDEAPGLDPCTLKHPLNGAFYDLTPLGSLGSEGMTQAWNAKGFDYGFNFTLGICSSPLKKAVVAAGLGDDFPDAQNISRIGGYYTDTSGVKYSIGEFNTTPRFRGRKLVMEYTDGSFCKSLPGGEKIRRSTLLSFTCDREIMAKAQISFVGALHDCDYFFDVRTIHACATAAKKDDLAIIWIFLLIFLAALGVYCSGGMIYKRIVLNRRGWKQLPSYGIMHKVKSVFTGQVSYIFLQESPWQCGSETNRGRQNRRNIRFDRNRFDTNNFDYLGSQNDLIDVLDIDSDGTS
ncbi:unnamed protein product [Kuraishia capsulata CBS 1993]|uniref:MRH domain-containing protein n=1 Tax=Kuraishia capsulata CBS 1993 TaxID=1382522 RepID=W6MLU6_9ASCO|nr:uncharacterized protein KUCA_T00001817001 [Kuraishia capsulata CBS 1993]CDK25847.1 unnamed protein product [Kuraishia capsulata CBS 1993]